MLVLYLEHHVGIGMRQIELVERLHFLRYAQVKLVGIVKEEDGTEQGALAYSLRTDEVNVSVQPYFGITYVGTVDEYYFP